MGYGKDTPEPGAADHAGPRRRTHGHAAGGIPRALILYSTLAKAPVLDEEHRKTSTATSCGS
ncbi:hypothetical protein GCM10023238_22590 [Streptomyces heliomycini]